MKTFPICTKHASFNAQCFHCYQVADSIERNKVSNLATEKQLAALQYVINSRRVTP